ncbi:MAG: thymidylate synthase [Bacillota bacterium]|nr:thymidylate synthase [Bacillota bacterium]
MEERNVLDNIKDRKTFRKWLEENASKETECWVEVKRGKPVDNQHFWYLDAVEEALCFGWIDSTHKLINGIRMQRFTPRKKNSPWTELNKERVRRLETLGLMTEQGRKVLPKMGVRSFKVDTEIEKALKQARVWSKFKSFDHLYQRIRAYNIAFYKKKDPKKYQAMLERLIEETKKGKMFGEWNDYGRLLNYKEDKKDD